MKLSLRELILAWLTGAVVLFLATWHFFASPRLDEGDAAAEEIGKKASDLESEETMLGQKAAWQAKLDEAIKSLAAYPETQDVTADMLIKVERLATGNNLVLTRRDPQRERRHGGLGTLDIKCSWEGTLEALTHFLFALRQDRGMLDISQLYIKSESKGLLRGTFTINCSYVRLPKGAAPAGTPAAEAAPAAPAPEAAPPPPAEAGEGDEDEAEE